MEDDEMETLDEEFLEETPVDTSRVPIAKQWTPTDTMQLLIAYKHFLPKKTTYATKKLLFEDISKHLEKQKIFFTGYQIENKFRGLLRTHRLSKQKGKYFSKINELVLMDPSMAADYYLKPTTSKNDIEVEDFDDEEWIQEDAKQFNYRAGPRFTKSGTPKKIWKIEEVYKLVGLYEKLLPEKSIFTTKKEWWNVIATNLRDSGVIVNGLSCEFKWTNIVNFYKKKGKNYPPRLNLHKKIERILMSQGLDNDGSDDDNSLDYFLDNDEEDCLGNKSTLDNIVVKIEPTQKKDIPELEVQNLPPFQEFHDESFEDQIMNYLRKKEIAKQKRHEESMKIKKKKLLILEKLCTSQK